MISDLLFTVLGDGIFVGQGEVVKRHVRYGARGEIERGGGYIS